MTDEVVGLFPIPLLRAPAVLPQPLVNALVDHFSRRALQANNSSEALSHTQMLQPSDSPLLVQAAALLTPKIAEFGRLLFGEQLGWAIKEMWVNVLDTGGRQAMHNHANSFASGVVYLTETHDSARTVFMKSPGGHDFSIKNDHAGVVTGAYNAEKWVSPAPSPGDLILFPSYLMHAVPPNAGGRRISLAFNAIPTRLESWGYTLSFNS
ncbi:putative 2OG-Fe(II) oxygenase [Roseateles sp.]|uniref:putative 2OG-Fe(II) oxygenase n=1 Tax=Roseateles sp. TaxID=1971397 RepID=UPI0032649F9C